MTTNGLMSRSGSRYSSKFYRYVVSQDGFYHDFIGTELK